MSSVKIPITKKYLDECFEIKDGDLYWRETRPLEHFSAKPYQRTWAKKLGGKIAGNKSDGKVYLLMRSFQRQYLMDIMTGEKPEEIALESDSQTDRKPFGYSELMEVMNEAHRG